MSIQVSTGIYYVTRSGEKVCVDDSFNAADGAVILSNGSCVWSDTGQVSRSGVRYPDDIVALFDHSTGKAKVDHAEIDVKANLADEAKSIVSGARRAAYGKPEDNFERIARFWQAYFENTGRGAVNLTAADVSPLMRLMKEARLCKTPDHRDSFVDLIGYTLTGAEINKVDPQKSA